MRLSSLRYKPEIRALSALNDGESIKVCEACRVQAKLLTSFQKEEVGSLNTFLCEFVH